MLYVVSTPIWNLEDMTYRAVRILNEVDLIACEDTRTSATLLNHYNIKKPLLSYHSHSWIAKVDKIIDYLKNGKKVALISDAWTPWISDPWYVLIKEAISNWFQVSPIPWASAVLSGLVCSSLPTNHFLYLWFLPIKKWRQTLLNKLKDKEYTTVFYESVHRIERTLKDFKEYYWWDSYIVIWRELTKKFEEFIRWTVDETISYFEQNKDKVKWEFVIIF